MCKFWNVVDERVENEKEAKIDSICQYDEIFLRALSIDLLIYDTEPSQ